MKKYDVVIIGGGIAGLSTGLYLQKMGKRSVILEHGQQVGGNMSGIWRKGFYFDCGDQSTENVGVLFPLLDELGLYDPDEWDRVRFRYRAPDCEVMFYEYDQMREDFKKGFPESRREIDKYFDYITPQCNLMREMMGSGEPFAFTLDGIDRIRGNLKMFAQGRAMGKAGLEMMTKTGDEKALELVGDKDPRLLFLFGSSNGRNLSLMMTMTFWYAYTQDYWYPKAGLQQFMNKMADAYRERGGEIHFKSTVDKVFTAGQTVTSVETAQGERFRADHFVNTGNPKRLINQMLDNKYKWDYKEREIISAAPVSVAISSAFLGVDMDDEELGKHMRGEHHAMYWRTYEAAALDVYDPEIHNKGWSMLNATSLHYPHLAPKGQNSLVVQTWMPYHWQNGWGTGSEDPFARGVGYRKLKKKVLDDIIRETEKIIPGLSEKIVYKELATPRTMARWTLNPDGAIMGWSYDSYECHMANKFVRFRTPFKNLFTAGHYAIWPGGVIFSALSGRIVAKGMYSGFLRQLFF